MNIPDPVDSNINQYNHLHNNQLQDRLKAMVEWGAFNKNSADLLELLGERFKALQDMYVPHLHSVFPTRSEHPKLSVVFTEFRMHPTPTYVDEGLLDVYCRVNKEGGGVEYWAQTFDREFKPVSDRMAPVTKELIIGLMQDRIAKV